MAHYQCRSLGSRRTDKCRKLFEVIRKQGCSLALSVLATTSAFANGTVDRLAVMLLTTGKCERCNLQGADLVYARIRGAKLQNADLSRTDLSHSDLEGADLRYADLRFANLSNSSLRGAVLTGAKLEGALLDQADMTGAELTSEQLTSANWSGAYGYDPMSLDIGDLYKLSKQLIGTGELKKADYFLTVSIRKRPEDPELWVARAMNRFKIGQDVNGIEDLKVARRIYAQQGDQVSVGTVDKFMNTHGAAVKASKPQRSGSGYGMAVVNGIQKLLPLLVPLAKKALMP